MRYAIRSLRRSPGFTLTAVAMLALGIGINVIVFTITNAALFKGFPLVSRNDRILYLSTGRGCCVSYSDFEDWRAQATSFVGMALVHGVQKSFSDGGGFPEVYNTTEVSADTFRLAGQEPIMGRNFTPSDERPGAAPVAILRYSFWDRRYQKDPAIIGHTARINGEPTTIVGVMPRGFSFPQNQDIWVPLTQTADLRKRENRGTWFAFARMKDGATVETARAEMEIIGRRLAIAYPLTNQGQNAVPHVANFHQFFIGANATAIYEAMLGAVGFVLLIACANLANLLLARSMGRSREISVRIALGAGRWRIVRQLLIESMMLAALGGLAAWWIARWGVRIYALAVTGASVSDSISGTWFDNMLDYTMDYQVFAYLIAITVGTGILFGLVPARRVSKLDINTKLKAGARGKHLSTLLVIGEMALAVVLLAGAGVMIRSFLNIYTADLGVKTENVLTALVSLPKENYPRPEAQNAFFDRLQARLKTLPGVESVAMASSIPAWGSGRLAYELAGADPVDEARRPSTALVEASPGYFHTLGTAVLSGREFQDADGVSGVPVAIVNERFATQYWAGENPLGKRLRIFHGATPGPWLSVVAIAPNIVQNDFTRQRTEPVVYLPYRESPISNMWVFARTRVPPGSLVNAFRREIQAIDPDLPTTIGPVALTEQLANGYQYRGVSGVLFLIFSGIALLLASLGLYAVMAHSVSQRTQEIGVRMAMGATARDIVKLVFRQGLMPLGIGLIVGLGASLAVNRLLQAQLVQVSPADPLTIAAASAMLILAATLGCWIPARRAMRVDPLVALRQE